MSSRVKNQAARVRLLGALLEKKVLDYDDAIHKLKISRSIILSLKRRGSQRRSQNKSIEILSKNRKLVQAR